MGLIIFIILVIITSIAAEQHPLIVAIAFGLIYLWSASGIKVPKIHKPKPTMLVKARTKRRKRSSKYGDSRI